MHSRPKRGSRIDMDHQFILILRFHLLPGRDHQDIIYIELMEILLPVIHPVYVLGLGFLNRTFADVQVTSHLFQFVPDTHQDRTFILLFFQIEGQICLPVILRNVRQDVYEHLLLVFLRKRDPVLDLYSLYP